MACGQCATGGCGNVNARPADGKANNKTAGCGSSGGCATGCTKLNTFDWLADMDVPASMQFQIVEVKFKGGRKGYFKNTKGLTLNIGDFVVCEMQIGYHIGMVSLQGELVRLQMLKKNIKKEDEEVTHILRLATERDLEKHQQAINRDLPTMYRVRDLLKSMALNMKLSDVEYQSDNSKATFYYSAEDRVDFRELIKILAGEFRIRVEMRQISLRQEAARLGGIGSCGRELCCSTWLTNFKSIPTAAARYQNLSLNPAKLSGQCGRLKCCLNYELETYVDALRDIPKVNKPLITEKGEAFLQKTDIFRRMMWFSFPNDSNWYCITCDRVVLIMEMNKEGKKPVSLEEVHQRETVLDEKSSMNSELDRLDKKLNKNRSQGKKRKKYRKPKTQEPGLGQTGGQKARSGAERPKKDKPRANTPSARSNRNKEGSSSAALQPRSDQAKRSRPQKKRNNRNMPKKNDEKVS